MEHLQSGQFFGDTHQTIHMRGLTLTDTEYTHDKVDWHYHENAYFTFILQGYVIEGNKKEINHCPAGTLLFHNWQDTHYNIKPTGFTRGFHIELSAQWFKNLSIHSNQLEGSINIKDPDVKILIHQIFKETKKQDSVSDLSIESLIVNAFTKIQTSEEKYLNNTKPIWVAQVAKFLNDHIGKKLTLDTISKQVGIHPVHLSRDFSKYFNCNLGDYIRKLKIQKALVLLLDKNLSLNDIAIDCGFADQSHFLRCFKEINTINPSSYRKILLDKS